MQRLIETDSLSLFDYFIYDNSEKGWLPAIYPSAKILREQINKNRPTKDILKQSLLLQLAQTNDVGEPRKSSQFALTEKAGFILLFLAPAKGTR